MRHNAHLILLKLLFTVVFSIPVHVAVAQNYVYDWGLRADLGLAQYSGDLEKQIGAFSVKAPSAAVTFASYWNPFFDWYGGLGLFLLDHSRPRPAIPETGDLYAFRASFLAVNSGVRLKMNNGYLMPEDNLLSPYIKLGVSINYTTGGYLNNKFIPSFPLGVGVTYHFNEVYSINAEWVYHRTFFDKIDDYADSRGRYADGRPYDAFALPTIGFQYNFGPEAGELSDADEDGIPDIEDECPTREGPPIANGCPDSDSDGLLDEEDACPNQVGPPSTKGCPDKDGDGLPDWQDRCPDRSGPAGTGGCPDTDADGLTDDIDRCPEKKGSRGTLGCPDTDADGVTDDVDKCPNAAGSKPSGCPDSDKDGIADDTDKCPDDAGSPALGGCPDSDGDGVPDNADSCPDEAGPVGEKGCPPGKAAAAEAAAAVAVQQSVQAELNTIVKNLNFEIGKAIIAQDSYDDLDKLVDVLNRFPNAKLSIEGHTDNQGELQKNIRISKERAQAVLNYLVESGISEARLKSEGFGPNKPLVPNTSRENRAKNRRVELILSN